MEHTRENFDFLEHFNIHYTLLLRRYEQFKKLDGMNVTNLDGSTYFDMIIVQIRALCIESPRLKKNYTAQVLLRKIGKADLADKLDAMLDSPLNDVVEEDYTIRKAIKTLVDGFICHYDNFDGDKRETWGWSGYLEKHLRNPYYPVNLDYIMSIIIECIGDGLSDAFKK